MNQGLYCALQLNCEKEKPGGELLLRDEQDEVWCLNLGLHSGTPNLTFGYTKFYLRVHQIYIQVHQILHSGTLNFAFRHTTFYIQVYQILHSDTVFHIQTIILFSQTLMICLQLACHMRGDEPILYVCLLQGTTPQSSNIIIIKTSSFTMITTRSPSPFSQ